MAHSKYTGLLLACALGATAALTVSSLSDTPRAFGQTWQTPVRGDRFELRDARGVARASLGLAGGNQELTFLYLMDSSGFQRVVVNVYPDARAPEVKILNAGGQKMADLVQGGGGKAQGGPPLRKVGGTGGKADDASPQAVRNLQSQIDSLRIGLNEAIDRINVLSR